MKRSHAASRSPIRRIDLPLPRAAVEGNTSSEFIDLSA